MASMLGPAAGPHTLPRAPRVHRRGSVAHAAPTRVVPSSPQGWHTVEPLQETLGVAGHQVTALHLQELDMLLVHEHAHHGLQRAPSGNGTGVQGERSSWDPSQGHLPATGADMAAAEHCGAEHTATLLPLAPCAAAHHVGRAQDAQPHPCRYQEVQLQGTIEDVGLDGGQGPGVRQQGFASDAYPALQQQLQPTQGQQIRRRWWSDSRQRRMRECTPVPALDPGDVQACSLTQAIMSAPSPGALLQLLTANAQSVNSIHVSAMLKRLVRLRVHCVSTVRAPVGAGGGASRQDRSPSRGRRAGDVGPGRPATASAVSEPSSGPAPMQAQSGQQHPWPVQLVNGLVLRLANLALQHLPSMGVKEVACVMSSLARLRAPLKKSYHIALLVHARNRFSHPDTNAWALVELLYALSQSGMQSVRADYVRYLFGALAARRQQMDIRTTVRALHTLATLGVRPPQHVVGLLCSCLHQYVDTAHPVDISNAAWALARLQVPVRAQLWAALQARAGQVLDLLDARELAVLLWSCANVQVVAGASPAPHADQGPAVSAGELPSMQGCVDNAQWRSALQSAACRHLYTAHGHSLALMVFSLGTLGWQTADVQTLVGHILPAVQQQRFAGLSPLSMCLLLHGAVRLGVRPDHAWLHAFHGHVERITEQVHPAVPGLMSASFAALGFEPPRALLATGDDSEATAVGESARLASTRLPAGGPPGQQSAAGYGSAALVRPGRRLLHAGVAHHPSVSSGVAEVDPSVARGAVVVTPQCAGVGSAVAQQPQLTSGDAPERAHSQGSGSAAHTSSGTAAPSHAVSHVGAPVGHPAVSVHVHGVAAGPSGHVVTAPQAGGVSGDGGHTPVVHADDTCSPADAADPQNWPAGLGLSKGVRAGAAAWA